MKQFTPVALHRTLAIEARKYYYGMLPVQVRLINAIYAAIEVADSGHILLIDYFALIYVLIKLLTLVGEGS